MSINGIIWVACTSTLLLLILTQRNRHHGLVPWNTFCWVLLFFILSASYRLLKAGTSPDSFVPVLGQTILQLAAAACLLIAVRGYVKQRKTS